MSLLKVENLTKKYDDKAVVNDVSFQFQKNNCIALIGPNGAGKTTILRTLAGILKPTAGTISFANMTLGDDIRKFIGYLPQYPAFFPWMSGKEFLVYVGQLAYLSKEEAVRRSDELLVKVGLKDVKNRRIGKYSGGMKQRLGIAQAIIHRPKLLLLDEPVSSLDPIGRREVLTLMEELKGDMTILFSTHILSDADEISDELLLLNKGQIVESGSMSELRNNYQTAKMEIGFAENLKSYREKINSLSEVKSCYIERNLLHVTAENIPVARQAILTKVSNENWPLTTFTINKTSLEDLFMKVVNS